MFELGMACCFERGAMRMIARVGVAVGLVVTAAQMSALAQKASPKEIECHAEATKRYINDFRQVGAVKQAAQESVVVLVNSKLNYEAYYYQCLGRWNSMKVR